MFFMFNFIQVLALLYTIKETNLLDTEDAFLEQL